MKYLKLYTAILLVTCAFVSCRKYPKYENEYPLPERRIQYSIYTDQDFSENNRNIVFRLVMRKHNQYGTIVTLWDSSFTAIKLNQLPTKENKLVVDKIVPGNDPSTLSIGVIYYLEDVGYSWLFDTCSAGVNFKNMELNYR